MTTTTDAAVWTPRGRPVRNFVVVVLAVTIVSLALWATGWVAPRLTSASGQGELNTVTGRFFVTLDLHNEPLGAVRVLGVEPVEEFGLRTPPSFRPFTLGGRKTAPLTVTGQAPCERVAAEPLDIPVRVRTAVGIEHTVTVKTDMLTGTRCAIGPG